MRGYRKAMSKKISRRDFSRKANRTHVKNAIYPVRGGVRL